MSAAMEAEPVAEAAPKAEPMDVSEAAASADEDSEQGDGFRTRGLRGDLHELPEPTVAYEDLTVQCAEALRVRGMSQTAVCAALALSPVYFSIWLKGKDMPKMTKQLYSSACELWLADPTFTVLDPALTRTNPSQVPRAKGAAREKESSAGGGGGGGGGPSRSAGGGILGGGPSAAKRRAQENDRLATVTTPLLILEELLSGVDAGREMAFQLQYAAATNPQAKEPSAGAKPIHSFLLLRARSPSLPPSRSFARWLHAAVLRHSACRQGCPHHPTHACTCTLSLLSPTRVSRHDRAPSCQAACKRGDGQRGGHPGLGHCVRELLARPEWLVRLRCCCCCRRLGER